MASNNKLIGSGVIDNVQPVVDRFAKKVALGFMYSEDCLGGKLYFSIEEKKALVAEGWKDHPGKVRLLPGHEKLFIEENKKVLEKEDSAPKMEAPKEKEAPEGKEVPNKQTSFKNIWPVK